MFLPKSPRWIYTTFSLLVKDHKPWGSESKIADSGFADFVRFWIWSHFSIKLSINNKLFIAIRSDCVSRVYKQKIVKLLNIGHTYKHVQTNVRIDSGTIQATQNHSTNWKFPYHVVNTIRYHRCVDESRWPLPFVNLCVITQMLWTRFLIYRFWIHKHL